MEADSFYLIHFSLNINYLPLEIHLTVWIWIIIIIVFLQFFVFSQQETQMN